MDAAAFVHEALQSGRLLDYLRGKNEQGYSALIARLGIRR